MVKNENAGKGRFEAITSKYMQAAAETPANATIDKKDIVETARPATRVTEQASTIADKAVNDADPSIKKRRHPAYKGDRIARTYKIPALLDEWMHKVYQEEGVEIQVQVTKAIKEWLDKNYSNFKTQN